MEMGRRPWAAQRDVNLKYAKSTKTVTMISIACYSGDSLVVCCNMEYDQDNLTLINIMTRILHYA